MLFKNIKYATRSLWRDKFYTALNGVGLAIGMAVALLIFLWVSDELSFDTFHTKKDRIHRVLGNWTFAGEPQVLETTPAPLAEAARSQLSEIESFVRTYSLWKGVIQYNDNRFSVDDGFFVDSTFFSVFDFSFLEGNAQAAFSLPNNVVLTRSLAEKIYGTTDIIGQPLHLAEVGDLTVSAVVADVPSNSHLQFNFLLPFEGNINKVVSEGGRHWGAFNYKSYVLLRPNVDVESVNKKLSDLIPVEEGQERTQSFHLQELTAIHLGSNSFSNSSSTHGDRATIRIMSVIGMLILLIACINYVNLTTARSAHKAKATGVRKVIGATRTQLFGQYMMETIILVAGSCFLAAAIADGSLGIFEELSGKHFTSNQLFSTHTLFLLLGTAGVTILLSGIQPALQLSAFRPLEAIRGSSFSKGSGNRGLRKILVTGQFVCSGALIICTFVMLQQMAFMKNQKLGYEREHIFSFYAGDADPLLLKTELMTAPGVKQVTTSDNSIVNLNSRYSGFDYQGKAEDFDPYVCPLNVEQEFPDFFDLNLLEGRWFHPGNNDTSSFILNEKAVAHFGIDNPVGKWMKFNGKKGSIVGVVKDFHFKSLKDEIEQLVLFQNPKRMYRVYVKTTGEQAATAIAAAEEVFKKHESEAMFNYNFLDDTYDNLYKTETRSSRLLAWFAILTILISCLGILGLAAYAAERRQKEIGIRKVLGASVSGLIALLSKDFLRLVFIALIIASPIAWYFMNDWLNNFAYRIDMPWSMFALAGLLAVAISLITVCLQSVRAALINPIESLKNE